jgi:hypothetical protein
MKEESVACVYLVGPSEDKLQVRGTVPLWFLAGLVHVSCGACPINASSAESTAGRRSDCHIYPQHQVSVYCTAMSQWRQHWLQSPGNGGAGGKLLKLPKKELVLTASLILCL